MDIGKQIAKYRKEKNITQEQLGEAVGVTNRTVSKWEQGVSLPGIDLVPQIAAALGITPNQLFGTETKEQTADISKTVGEAVSAGFEDYLYDAVDDALKKLLPKYLNGFQGSDGYSLLVVGRKKTSVCLFNGQGTVQGPFKWDHNSTEVKFGVRIGEVFAEYYDTKEEAIATLEAIIKAYTQKMKTIEL
ncbi:MAG: helix-turn-helix transcriptional regulator [Clostridia bacterium]|nr:helix-turn-helix transcriptional regulator [Clostridia bacterium]